MNIAGKLLEEFGFEPLGPSLYARGDVALLITDAELIYAEGLAADLQPKAMIFASRHASTQAVPTLSTHTPGNLGPWAEHGGKPREIAWSDPRRMKAALIALSEAREALALSDYQVSLEATHHGPTGYAVPVLFVEIGSTHDRWVDPSAGEAVAQAIWEAATRPARGVRAVGVGGGHYAPKLTGAVLESDVAIGHLVPKYVFQALGQDRWLLEETARKTWGGCQAVVIDKKGLRGPDRRFVISVAEELGLEVILV